MVFMSIREYFIGAERGSRTPTSISLLDPEPSASTNSAIPALCVDFFFGFYRQEESDNFF